MHLLRDVCLVPVKLVLHPANNMRSEHVSSTYSLSDPSLDILHIPHTNACLPLAKVQEAHIHPAILFVRCNRNKEFGHDTTVMTVLI